MAASVLAVPVGVLFLSLVPANAIKTMAGVLIVLVSLAMLSGRSFRVRSERLAYLPIGFLSGFLNGSISMSGPPVALFMSNQNIEKDRFRANITAYAVILNVFTLATFSGQRHAQGRFDRQAGLLRPGHGRGRGAGHRFRGPDRSGAFQAPDADPDPERRNLDPGDRR